MKTAKTLHVADCVMPLAAICLMFPGCKKDDPGPVVNNELFGTVALVTTGGSFSYPSSAVPDASNRAIYFTGLDSTKAGVFSVPAGGGTATALFTGAPFNRPIDLALSTDNQTLFIADSGAGAIYSLNIAGGAPLLVPGTAGTSPVALEVIRRGGQDQIYFCGSNPADGQAAIFEIASSGAASPILRHKGAPLVSPAGIVSAVDGTLFIADGGGMVHKLTSSGAITRLADGIIMGVPAGIALTPDDDILAVSSKSPGNGTAQVQLIDLQNGSMSVFNKVIGANSNPGGLHVARNASGSTGKYAWADVSRSGRVYRLEP